MFSAIMSDRKDACIASMRWSVDVTAHATTTKDVLYVAFVHGSELGLKLPS